MPRLLLYWTDTSTSSPNAIPANPSLLSFTLALLLRTTQFEQEQTHHGLIFIRGIGAHVKKTVRRRKDFLPQTSERAPINGALRKESRP